MNKAVTTICFLLFLTGCFGNTQKPIYLRGTEIYEPSEPIFIFPDDFEMANVTYVVSETTYIERVCEELTIEDTADCFVDYVRSFYRYRETIDTVKDKEETIKNGGDCYDYSNLYKQLALELGFKAEVFVIDHIDYKHAFTIISDRTGYCHLDMITDPRCLVVDGKQNYRQLYKHLYDSMRNISTVEIPIKSDILMCVSQRCVPILER